MIKIFGKNNNQLFRSSQKITYSMPQTLSCTQSVLKCACGFDYIALITNKGQLYFVFQSKFYIVENVPQLFDIATSENTITMVTVDNQILVWDFDQQKVMNKMINYTKIKIKMEKDDSIRKVQMGCNDIFLISDFGKVYHFKRNQWYETKSFSNIQSVELSHKIVEVSSGPNCNIFLSYEGTMFSSSKDDPLHLTSINTSSKFIKVATHHYNVGITKKGTLMIWGNSIHGKFKQPTQFSKLTKKFIDVKLDKENGYALADDGQIWVWGVNSNGQLGLSDYETRIKPFPMVTLDKFYALEIYSGHSYACCICEPTQKKQKGQIEIIDRRVSQFASARQQSKLGIKSKGRKQIFVEQNQYEIKNKQFISPSPSQMTFSTKKAIQNAKAKQPENRKLLPPRKTPSPNLRHRRTQSGHSQHSHNSNKSCNSQKSKKGQRSSKDGKQLTQTKLKLNNPNNANKSNRKDEMEKKTKTNGNWLISERDYEQQASSTNRNLQYVVQELKQENYKLKTRVTEQQQIINDITCKIRLLQQAIEQYERNLTSRDHIVQQYQSKQHQYISHIESLQKSIDEIVRNKEKNNEVMVFYDDLKSNFQKQRSYYTDKIKQYEIRIHSQQSRYKKQLQQAKRKGEQAQRQPQQNYNYSKQNKFVWSTQSPIIKKQAELPYFKGEFLAERNPNLQVDHVIDQIETNKSRITKSANKLIAMLDISQ